MINGSLGVVETTTLRADGRELVTARLLAAKNPEASTVNVWREQVNYLDQFSFDYYKRQGKIPEGYTC
jgi:N-acetylglutamate synthase-like GNAT family acetyltransferase